MLAVLETNGLDMPLQARQLFLSHNLYGHISDFCHVHRHMSLSHMTVYMEFLSHNMHVYVLNLLKN